MTSAIREVLLVEDNPDDVLLLVEALKQSPLPIRLYVAKDGQEALALLRHHKALGLLPDLILLDLNLPNKDGHQVLSEIKADDALKATPVLILTSSQDEQDILRCYKSYANSYITKPIELEQLFEMIQLIVAFWLKVARLPWRA